MTMRALFDMDGTLFAGDSLLLFARRVLRRHGWRRLYLLAVLPGFCLHALGLLSTQTTKRLFLSCVWGMRREQLEAECSAFVEQELLPALYPPLRERIAELQAAGAELVLCSASPQWWTELLGAKLGFSRTISTPVLLRADRVPFMPSIPPPGNNKGQAKVLRLAQIGITHADIGFSDSSADLPMLTLCKHAVLVNPPRKLQRALPEAEIIRTPRCPEQSIFFLLRCLFGF